MKLIVLSLVGSLLIALSLTSFRDFGAAHADGSAMVDAGIGSGSAVAAPAPPVLHDPTEDPGAFITDLKDAKRTGWPLAILFGVFGLCEGLAALGKKVTSFAFLGKGRLSIVIAGVASIVTAAIAAMTHSGTWPAVLTTLITAYAFYAHPAGTDPAKS